MSYTDKNVPTHDGRFKVQLKVIAQNSQDWQKSQLNEIEVVDFEIIGNELEPRDSFLLRLMREQYGKKVIEQTIEMKDGREILNITLKIGVKEVLFKFHLVESNIAFRLLEDKSNAFAVNIEIGTLDAIEKYHLVRNEFHRKIRSDLKGIMNEDYVVQIAQRFAEENNYEFVANKELDNKGVDFCLKDKFFGTEFYFQVKSSWSGVAKAKKLEKDVYQGKKIIFLVNNKKIKGFYKIIRAEIKKQKESAS